jgi:hypothetical protein
LQDNGGPRLGVFGAFMPTLLPSASSPAIDAGTTFRCTHIDQRGFPRVLPCDIGALERVFLEFLPTVER